MAEFFEEIKIECYISGAWLDLTPDVLHNPRPRWNRGIMGNSQLDRVGQPGYFSFALNNSQSNSVQTLSYYTPRHPNSLSGWTSGLPVRLSFVFDNLRYYKYYGRIMPAGIQVVPGVKGERYVTVRCHDFMALASAHELQLLTLEENKRIDEVMPSILANMPIQPLATDYATGNNTFPVIFDTIKTRTTALAEFQKLANSELGAIYARGDRSGGETLVVESENTRSEESAAVVSVASSECGFLLLETGDYLLLETGDRLTLNETQEAVFDDTDLMDGTSIVFGKNLANRVEVTTYPRKVDAAATTVLWSLQEPFEIGAGETKSNYVCRYRDPNGGASYVAGRNMVTPVSGTDYAAFANSDGTGANYTANLTVTAEYGTEAVSYTLTNTGANALYVTTLQARGKGIYIYDAVRIVYNDDPSQATHGVHSLSVDMKYQPDPTAGEIFALTLLERESNPDYAIERAAISANKTPVSMAGFLELEPGKRLKLSEEMTGIDRDYFVQGYDAEIIDGKFVMWYPVLQWSGTSTGAWVLGTSRLNISTVLGA